MSLSLDFSEVFREHAICVIRKSHEIPVNYNEKKSSLLITTPWILVNLVLTTRLSLILRDCKETIQVVLSRIHLVHLTDRPSDYGFRAQKSNHPANLALRKHLTWSSLSLVLTNGTYLASRLGLCSSPSPGLQCV